jgi:hypothetical protein
MADLQSNISSLVPSNITNTLSQIQNPQSFGDQLLDNAKKQVINAALGIVQKLKDEIQKTILRKIEFEKNHIKKLLELSKQNIGTTTYEFGRVIEIPPTLSDEEFQDAVALENFSYEKEKLIIDKNLKGLKDRLQKILLDPFIKIKTDYAQFKGKVAGRKLNRESLKQLYKSEKVQQLLKNVFKGLVQITASLLTGELIKVIANSAELQELVDKTNEIIDNAVTLPQLNQARIARNGAISTINRQENRIRAILKVLQTLNVILTIFGILTAILNIIPVPSPFGVLAKPATIKWSNAKEIRDGIGITVSILIPMLTSAIYILEDLKRQLREINQKIEDKTLDLLDDNALFDYISQITLSSENPISDINRRSDESDSEYADRLRNSTSLLNLLAKQNPGVSTTSLQDTLDNSSLSTLNGLVNKVLPNNNNNNISNNNNNSSNNNNNNIIGNYKGFTFVLKKEDDPKFVVKGNKRHYAVAINTKGIQQLKSDYSFTLDPQQLVNQLKLVIDQQNLQG